MRSVYSWKVTSGIKINERPEMVPQTIKTGANSADWLKTTPDSDSIYPACQQKALDLIIKYLIEV